MWPPSFVSSLQFPTTTDLIFLSFSIQHICPKSSSFLVIILCISGSVRSILLYNSAFVTFCIQSILRSNNCYGQSKFTCNNDADQFSNQRGVGQRLDAISLRWLHYLPSLTHKLHAFNWRGHSGLKINDRVYNTY